MVVLGRVVAPYGVRGWLKVRPFGDDPEAWGAMPQWWLGPGADVAGGDNWQAFGIESFRPHGAGWIVKLAGVDDRTRAEQLDGWLIGAPREALPQTARNEYYWTDLIGLAVVNEQGESMGRVESLIETGAHQVLVVKGGSGSGSGSEAKERLLPFVGEVIRGVDVVGGCIRVAWGKDW